MVDEETPLTGGAKTAGQHSIKVNIERLRFFGLSAMIVLLITGRYVTMFAVNWPPKENPSSVWDKIFNGAPSDFEYDKTFIYSLFHFNHTCTMLDFNPSRTISALVMMFHTVPTDLFIILHYYRVMSQGDAFKYLKIYSKIATPLQFIFTTYFFMVFVNAPDTLPGEDGGARQFTLHYTPYMLWQIGMWLMAIQQCWFIYLKGKIPFAWVSKKVLEIYLITMGIMLVVYCWFVWSFIHGRPLWDTTTTVGRRVAQVFMMTWNAYCIVIPATFAWFEGGGDDFPCTEIVFNELN